MTRRLYYHTSIPLARMVRAVLLEKSLEFVLSPFQIEKEELPFYLINEKVILMESNHLVVIGSSILDYLEEMYPARALLPTSAVNRAEVRRLVYYCLNIFQRDVTEPLIGEKVIKRLRRQGSPEQNLIRNGQETLLGHLRYLQDLAETRRWLGGEVFSYADLGMAAQISLCDYVGSVSWDKRDYADVKEWYTRIKSRPSLRAILADTLPSFHPPDHYSALDF